MSLDKAVEYGKEYRKPYRSGSAKDVDRTCRNHGSCPSCSRLRQHRNQMAEEAAIEQMKDIYADENDS